MCIMLLNTDSTQIFQLLLLFFYVPESNLGYHILFSLHDSLVSSKEWQFIDNFLMGRIV